MPRSEGKPARETGSAPEKPDRPPAPWDPFPLVELCVLAGIVLIVWGAIATDPLKLGLGLLLGSLGGLELTVREHFAGYRSHTSLLSGVVAIVFATALFFFAELVLWICCAAGAAAFAICFLLFRKAFQKASGGLSFRVGNLSG